jgi:diguanylate cyclase (GGDEF)-like protein/PAS domain S-box-containing protein
VPGLERGADVAAPRNALSRPGELAIKALGALPQMSILVFDRELRFALGAGEGLLTRGYTRGSVEGRTLSEVLPPAAAERLEPHYRAALAGRESNFVYEALERDRTYEVQIGPIHDDGEVVGGLVIAREVTAQRHAEAEPADIERRYRELAEHSSDVVTRSDAAGVYCYVSPSSARVYGWAPEQMVGRPVRDFLHPDDHERHAQVRASLHDGADEQGAEFRVPCADGRWLWVEIHFSVLRNRDGSVREVQAAARDISERKEAESARRVADEQFRTAFDDAPIGMALVAPDGEWLRVNPALCAIVGYSPEELLGKTFQDITHPDDLDADVGLLREVLSGERSGYQLEKRYLRSTGEVVWALLSVSLVRDASDRPLHFISQVQDVTERRALEAQLRRLATRDDLTGLSNRRMFQRALAQQIPRIARYREEASVLVGDLDGFKAVNDTHGHHAGDALLRHVAGVLAARLRESDVLARLGGDEFAILLPRTDGAAAGQVAAALEHDVATNPLALDGVEIHARISIGVAVLNAEGRTDDALREADRAMYRVKQERR